MKESIYGWYPPANDVWKTYRAPRKTYENECLYKHHDSRYNDRMGVPTPTVPTPLRMTPQQGRASPRAQSAGRPSSHTPQTDGLLIESIRAELQRRPQSQTAQPPPSPGQRSPYKGFSPAPPSRSRTAGHRPSPQRAWSMNLPETQVSGPHGSMSPQVGTAHQRPLSSHPASPSDSARPSRIQSATQYRSRVTPPSRPAKSAGPTRGSVSVPSPELTQGPVVTVRPAAPPPTPGPPEEEEELGEEYALDYDQELERHGWRMEVPGDPLRLKRPCIQKRLPYTCKLADPTVKPRPPGVKMENWETFFYNTIPRRPMTFAIHKEWISETLCAKRLELQKRDGADYKYKHTNFSFVY